LSGTISGFYLQLCDGASGQCCIVFRSDGAVVLTSGTPAGTTLATYTGAFAAAAWTAFEFEVVINNTTGSFTVRKNGNTSNDFTATSLNTRGGTANNYANRLQIGMQSASAPLGATNAHKVDDLLWRSDAVSVAWVGDVRCYTRMPSTTASAQFSVSPAVPALSTGAIFNNVSDPTGTSRYAPFTPGFSGAIGTAVVSFASAFTGNLKGAIFADSAGLPGAVLGSANVLNNPVSGSNTITFSTPVAVTKGVQYWLGISHDVTASVNYANVNTGRTSTTVAYASFPSAAPGVGAATSLMAITVNITPSSNAEFVNEAQQDGATSYVYDSTVGHQDFYNLAALSGTPASTIAVTTRGFLEKSDAGTRNGAVQLKSGATTVASTSTALSTSWGWLWRTDTTDPNTGAAWTATGVNNAQIGPLVAA
jgi:hypothetical protein